MRLTDSMRQVLHLLNADPHTAEQVAAALRQPVSSVRGRLRNALKEGWVKETQTTIVRTRVSRFGETTRYSRGPSIYEITEAGVRRIAGLPA